MIAVQNRFKQDRVPSGGSALHEVKSVGARFAVQNRFKQDRVPSGGSAAAMAANVGAL
jgi:hypothetical protein